VYLLKRWIGKNVKITLIAALTVIFVLAAPTAMTTKVYADDVSTEPVGNSPPPATDDQKQQKPAHDNNPPSDDKNKQPTSHAGVCVVGVESPCNAKEFQDPNLLGPGPKPKPFDCNGGLIDDKGNCISNISGPDESCIFDPTQKKCAPDDQGNCPSGFSHNSKDQCFPSHKCSPGFAREDNDESGACKKIPIK